MTAILSEIDRQKRREQVAAWDKAEAELAAEVTKTLELERKLPGAVVEANAPADTTEELAWQTFVDFCNKRNVRRLPAKPSTVAGFLLYCGLSHESMLDALAAITRAHDRHGLSNPTATAICRAVLEMKLDEPPPQSWSKAEREFWPALNVEVRAVLRRIDLTRRKEIGRCQREAADLSKKYETKAEENPTNGQAAVSDQDSRAAVGL
jgi:hypothetical protein